MQRRAMPVLAGAVLCALALAGCGGATAADPAANVPKIELRSPAIHGTSLPATFTCDGKNTPPPLEWGTVPPGTGSLVLFVVGIAPRPNSSRYTISVDWAVAGLNPHLHRLDPGRLPHGAVVGVASDGRRHYSICPKAKTLEQFQFELYGLPVGAVVARQFAGVPILSALDTRSSSSPADAYGDIVTTYKRT
jgi:phosphatidylethanolamine-binding protein (PEBP) family uncharacterized protein